MEARPPKKAKLEKLDAFRRQLPFITATALASVLSLVEKEGVPPSHSRKNIKEAVQSTLADMNGTYGHIIQPMNAIKIHGAVMKVHALNLQSMLQGLFQQEGYWQQMFLHFHVLRPSSLESPWKGIIYADEVHPGNQLSSTERKVWCVYFSWLDLGKRMLSDERNWFTLMVLRSEEVNLLQAGIGQCWRLILETMFTNPLGNPLHGVMLSSRTLSVRFFWNIHMFLQDGSAQKFTFSNKQDSGSQVCMLCANIFNVREENEDNEHDHDKISAKYLTWDACQPVTDAELLQSWERLADHVRTDSKSKFKQREQACGWTFSQYALLMSSALRNLRLLKPASQYCYDWMHGMCSNGTLNFIILWTFEAFREAGMPNVWQPSGRIWTWGNGRAAKCRQLPKSCSAMTRSRVIEKLGT